MKNSNRATGESLAAEPENSAVLESKKTRAPGAGRPRPKDLPKGGELVKVTIAAWVDQDSAAWVKNLKDKSAFLRAAIAHFKNLHNG